MQWFDTVLLGAIQGITEFLPISSSGHLWLTEQLILNRSASLPLMVLLHLVSLLTVIWVFRKKLLLLIQSIVSCDNTPHANDSFYNRRLAWQLLLATGITGVVGLTLKNFIQHSMDQSLLITSLLITSAIVFGSTIGKLRLSIQNPWLMMALLGLIQGLAVFPGISRSGLTIGFLLLLGMPQQRAVDIAFLLSIPAISGAFLICLPELFSMPFTPNFSLITASLVAAACTYVMIHSLRKNLKKIWLFCGIWCLLLAGGLVTLT